MILDSTVVRRRSGTDAGPTGGTGSGGLDGAARFVTGEAVSLHLPVARLGSRMLARMLDLLIQFVMMFLLFMGATIGTVMAEGAGLLSVDAALIGAIGTTVAVVVLVGYPVTLETLTRGRTLGKAALGLRVVRDDGGPIRFRQAMTRGLVGAAIEYPGALAPPLTWLACLLTMSISPAGKRLGDYAAGTLVVHDRSAGRWGWAPPMPPGLAHWAATLDLAGLDDDLALTVRHFLARSRKLTEPARTRLGDRLFAEVAAATRPPPPPGTPGWAYLAAVHAERHRRAMHRLAAVRPRAAAVWPSPRPRP